MQGEKITINHGVLTVPNNPILPFIEGDGTGPDIWKASKRVLDAAVEKAYNGTKKIEWKEVLAGEKAFNETGNWLPDETLDAFITPKPYESWILNNETADWESPLGPAPELTEAQVESCHFYKWDEENLEWVF